MKIGIIGSGGREHALCYTLKKSKKVKKIYCFPGNGGTAAIAENISIDLSNFQELKNIINKNKIDLIVVGPEKPLVEGVVDFLKLNKIKVFGPNKLAAQLEGSKIFTKNLCEKYKIPTAKFGVFEKENEAIKFVKHSNLPVVIKADGLASGKGVYICQTIDECQKAIDEIFGGKFGKAKNLLIEEFLTGEEMSFFILSDGKSIKTFQTAQDHKRVLEGDLGKNTGGMGAYSPSRLINKVLEKKILNKIIYPTIQGLQDMNVVYSGFLYAGLMIVKDEPYLIEYNVRMGDPECQTILPKLNTDLFDIILACCNEELEKIDIKWNNKKSLCIVLCSKGYPDKYDKEVIIDNLKEIKPNNNDFCFHAGTKFMKNEFYSIGGRVLNFVSVTDSFEKSRERIISLIEKLNWKKGFFRKDIGYKVIPK